MRKEEGDNYLPSIAWIEDEIYAMRLKGFFLIGIVELGQKRRLEKEKRGESKFPFL